MNKLIHSSLITIVLAIALYGGFTLFSGGQAVWQSILSLSIQSWLVILGLSLANYGLRYVRWHWYIQAQSKVSISHLKHLSIYLAGFSLTMTPGKAGEAMRSLYLKQQGVDHQCSMAALFVERIMDLLAVLLLAGLGLSLLDGDMAKLASAVTFLLIASCIVLIKLPTGFLPNLSLVKKLPEKLQKLAAFIDAMLASAKQLLGVKLFTTGLAVGVFAWFLEGYGLYWVMHDYQAEISSISNGVAIYAIAVLVGALAFLPGGLGGTEAAMVFLLVKIGFSAPEATAITLICRIATLWFAMFIGIVVMFLMSLMGFKPVISELADNELAES